MADLSRAFAQQLGGFSAFTRQMEAQQRMLARAAMPLQRSMLGATFNLRNSPLLELSRSAQQTMETMEARQIRPLTMSPTALLNRREVTFGDVLKAADSAAEVMAERGATRQASELRYVTREAREVAERPSLERIEEMVADLSKRFEEESKKREHDENEKLVVDLFLFFLQILFALFLELFGLPRPRR